jgi:hypothetical protein
MVEFQRKRGKVELKLARGYKISKTKKETRHGRLNEREKL